MRNGSNDLVKRGLSVLGQDYFRKLVDAPDARCHLARGGLRGWILCRLDVCVTSQEKIVGQESRPLLMTHVLPPAI